MSLRLEAGLRTLYTDGDSRLNVVRRFRRITVVAIVVFGMSLATTGLAWRSNRIEARERARTRLQQEIDRTRANIRTRLVVYEDALYGTRSLFEANRVVTRAMFRNYVTNLGLEHRYPGIRGIGYSEWIPPSRKAAHVARIRREGFPAYNIRPEGQRAEYTSIIYLEPFDWRNQRAFAYDMFSEPTRRAAMKRARDTGSVAMTAKLTLLQETDQNVQAGFIMYLPLYHPGRPQGTIEERRTALVGYIYSPFRMGDFLSELPQESFSLANFEIFAGSSTAPDTLMYREPQAEQVPANYVPAVTQNTELDFGGQTWTIRFTTSPNFDAVVHEGQSRVLLPAGVAVGVLLFGIIISIAQTQRRAVRLADMITAKLRESEERVRAITETATDGIITADARGRIVYCNPAAERMFGHPAANVEGQSLTMLMPQAFQTAHGASFERLLRREGARMSGRTVEMSGRRADGTEFPVLASLSSWQADEVFFTAILHDITNRKLTETNIMKLNQELSDALFRSEKLAITGRLMATIAHEINNPLAALTNLLFVLESDNPSPSSKKFLRMAQDQVATLTNISRQTLKPYREVMFPTATNISELLDDVLSMLRPRLLASKVHVVRDYPASIEVKIYASELRQVFTNLVANAADAMPRGGRLTLSVISYDEKVHISVADTGTGIAPEHQDKLFEPFFTTKGEHGTGVGLWVVKEIINRIGGAIQFVTSTDPQSHGTTFMVSVPVVVQAVEERRPESANSMTAGQ